MISRRLLMRAAGVAALAGVATRPSAAQGTPGLADLKRIPPAQSPVRIEGQGWFDAVPAEGEADGILRIAGPDGAQWVRRGGDGTLDPRWFADGADGADDAPMIQRACDHAARFGPFLIDLGNRRYRCETPLSLDPTRVALRGVDALLDFSSRTPPPPGDPLLTLDRIAEGNGWRMADGAFSAGAEAAPLATYLTLPDDGRYRVEFTVGTLGSQSDYPSLTVEMSTVRADVTAGLTVIAPGRYTFEVDGPLTAARLTLSASADVRLDALTVTAEGRRECIRVTAGTDSPQYGHKWIEGIDVLGPGPGGGLHGIRFETRETAKSSRLALRQVSVRGFDTGLVFSHRAYLIHGTRLRIACDTGLHFLGGSEDAGELITLTDSVIDGGRIALRNDGGEFVMTGCAIDFVDQVMVGAGRLTLQGCHLEVNRPKAADAPLFDVTEGVVAITGGSFGVTGHDFEAGNACDHIFELRSRAATATMSDVAVYNLRSQSNALAGGPGWLDVARVRGRRPRHMAPIVQFDPARNCLGPLPLDLRTSATADGTFERFPTAEPRFKVSPAFRYVWLFGTAPAGVELGAALQVKTDRPGQMLLLLQAFNGAARVPIGESWPVDVTTEWQRLAEHTGDSHPTVPAGGRVPAGYQAIALMLDLSGLEGTVEIANPFVTAT
ncbi:hypothetical protein [Jannaschia marina]|uniref:hypothetical protein n=1 Tax=Jannaschia marina TaxID=2741674 RepID=UPI0015CCCE9F|nr:hypothetical protein [Jannaschia marina]